MTAGFDRAAGWVLALVLVGAAQGAPVEKPAELYPFQAGRKWGYIDASGDVVIPPRFRDAEPFTEGLARVRSGDRFVLIDASGREVVAPEIEDVVAPSEGVAIVVGHDGPMFRESSGRTWRPRAARALRRFSEGLAAVSNEEDRERKWGFVDRKGKRVIEERFDDVGEFHGGLAPAKLGELWGLVDREGRWVAEPRYDDILLVSAEGPILARAADGYRYIARDGTELPGLYGGATPFAEGLAAIAEAQDAPWEPMPWWIVDESWRRVAGPFERAEGFAGGLAPVALAGRWGYVDATGNMVIAPTFEEAWMFEGALASVVLPGGEDAYIDRAGAVVWKGKLSYEFEWRCQRYELPEGSTVPPEEIRAANVDLAGTWDRGCVLEGASLRISARGDGAFDVHFETAGCLGGSEADVVGRLVSGVLVLDEPVAEYGSDPYERLHPICLEGFHYLMPETGEHEVWLLARIDEDE